MICDYCRHVFKEKEPSIKYCPGTIETGKKSGGVYHSDTFERPYLVHQECLLPMLRADKDMLDMLRDRIIAEVRREEIEDLRMVAMSEAAEDLKNLCAECQENKLEPDLPKELPPCENCGSSALPICPDCGEVHTVGLDEIDAAAA